MCDMCYRFCTAKSCFINNFKSWRLDVFFFFECSYRVCLCCVGFHVVCVVNVHLSRLLVYSFNLYLYHHHHFPVKFYLYGNSSSLYRSACKYTRPNSFPFISLCCHLAVLPCSSITVFFLFYRTVLLLIFCCTTL